MGRKSKRTEIPAVVVSKTVCNAQRVKNQLPVLGGEDEDKKAGRQGTHLEFACKPRNVGTRSSHVQSVRHKPRQRSSLVLFETREQR
jgi:hypothetical protein